MADYCTYSQWKADTNTTDSGAAVQATIERLISAASGAIDRFCNRPDGFLADDTASARYYVGSGKTYQRIDEAATVTAVAVKDSPSDDEDSYTAWTLGTVGTTTSADCFPASGDPAYPNYTTTPYTLLIIGANGDYPDFTSGSYTHRGGFRPTTTVTRGVPTVKVTARWGYATVAPPGVRTACLMQVQRWYKRLTGGMGDALASGELGQILYEKKLDPDVQMILVSGRYVRPAVGRS